MKNIRFKLLFWLGIFLIFVFSLFGYILMASLKHSNEKILETTLSMAIKDLKYEYENSFNYNIDELKDEFGIDKLYIQIVDISSDDFKIVQKSKELKEHTLNLENINLSNLSTGSIHFQKQKNIKLTESYIKIGATIAENKNGDRVLLVFGVPFDKHPIELKKIKYILIGSLIAILSIILIATNIIISKSFLQIATVLNELNSPRELFATIKKTGVAKEIDDMIDSFNNLLKKIDVAYKKSKEFGQNASHELKTPLTIIRGEAELGLRRDRSIEQYKDILRAILKESISLQEIIERVLFLANSDEERLQESFTEVNIATLLTNLLSQKQEWQKIDIKLVECEDIYLNINEAFFKIAIVNLIDNAIKYSPHNPKIELSLTKDYLSIKDFGYGISSSDIGNIFDRFYRSDKTREIEGSGLGLSIVQNIINLHRFELQVHSKEGKGSTFFIKFHK